MNRAATAKENRVHIFCPGCDAVHGIVVAPNKWSWNGDLVNPTFSPSLLVKWNMGNFLPEDHPDFKRTFHVCHSFVTDGRIQFLPDSTHELAGQTVELPPWPYV